MIVSYNSTIYFFHQQIYQYLWYLGELFRQTPIIMLSQQMKSCDSIKIETVGVRSPTDQLIEEFCRLNHHTRLRLGMVSLNRHNSSPIDTSSIAITHYNIQCTSNNASSCQSQHQRSQNILEIGNSTANY